MEQRTVPEAESSPAHPPSGVDIGKRLAIGAATLVFAFGAGTAAGCGDDDEGPAEEAGQAIDDTAEEAGQAIDDTAEDAEKEVEEADQEIGDDEK